MNAINPASRYGSLLWEILQQGMISLVFDFVVEEKEDTVAPVPATKSSSLALHHQH